MKTRLLTLMLSLVAGVTACLAANAQPVGDVTGDGTVDVSDVNAAINLILKVKTAADYPGNADLTGDDIVDVSDVNAIINIILTGTVPPEREQGDLTFVVNGVTFKMVLVEEGTFTMGATPEQGTDATNNEKPAHDVTLSTYWIGQTEVTQELWLAVMGDNPSSSTSQRLQRPVDNVGWNECQQFIAKLNELTGRTFRLPTEAEWEFAARGGNKSQGYKFAGSNNLDDVAWYYNTSNCYGESDPRYGTQDVATKAPNELGLYDMSGNVWEWCNDWYRSNYYQNSPAVNPPGPDSGMECRVLRGGCCGIGYNMCRVAYRNYGDIRNKRHAYKGMRLAL